jgi:hypothetical protein
VGEGGGEGAGCVGMICHASQSREGACLFCILCCLTPSSGDKQQPVATGTTVRYICTLHWSLYEKREQSSGNIKEKKIQRIELQY